MTCYARSQALAHAWLEGWRPDAERRVASGAQRGPDLYTCGREQRRLGNAKVRGVIVARIHLIRLDGVLAILGRPSPRTWARCRPANRASHLHDRRWGEAAVCSHQGEVCGGRAGEQDLDADKAGEAAVLSAIDASQLAWEARTCPRSAANPGTEPTI